MCATSSPSSPSARWCFSNLHASRRERDPPLYCATPKKNGINSPYCRLVQRTEIDPDKFVYSGYIAHPLQTVNVVPGSDTFNRIIRGCCAAVWALDFSACLPDRALLLSNDQMSFLCGPGQLRKLIPLTMTDCKRLFPENIEGECEIPRRLEAV